LKERSILIDFLALICYNYIIKSLFFRKTGKKRRDRAKIKTKNRNHAEAKEENSYYWRTYRYRYIDTFIGGFFVVLVKPVLFDVAREPVRTYNQADY